MRKLLVLLVALLLVAAAGAFYITRPQETARVPYDAAPVRDDFSPEPVVNAPIATPLSVQSSPATSTYADPKYGFSFSYPSAWRFENDSFDQGGTMYLYNYPDGTGSETFKSGMSKIQIEIVDDPAAYYGDAWAARAPVAGAPTDVYYVTSEVSRDYAIAIPSLPGSYLVMGLYGDATALPVVANIVQSLTW